jgi:hypothetical protein
MELGSSNFCHLARIYREIKGRPLYVVESMVTSSNAGERAGPPSQERGKVAPAEDPSGRGA